MKDYPTTDKEIAAFWGVAMRTLFRWKADGAPIRDHDEMLRWFATRKNLPKSVLGKTKLPPGENVSSPGTSGAPGAAAALRRLEEAELAAFERLQIAIADGNPLVIKEAHSIWLKMGDSLRKFDLMVEATRRQAGDLIPRAAMEAWMKHFFAWVRSVFTMQSEDLTNQLVGKNELETCRILRDALTQSLFETVLGYIGGSGHDARLTETARQYLVHSFGLTPIEVAGYVAEYVQAMASIADSEVMVSKAAVDRRARDASRAISRHLDEFVSQVATRLPGENIPANINLLLDHMRPTLAEIEREISLFRVEVGCAPPALTLQAVNDQCAKFWREWQRQCGVRADGFERRGK